MQHYAKKNALNRLQSSKKWIENCAVGALIKESQCDFSFCILLDGMPVSKPLNCLFISLIEGASL